MAIQSSVNKADWSNYEKFNDYSFGNSKCACVYMDDQLIQGVELLGSDLC